MSFNRRTKSAITAEPAVFMFQFFTRHLVEQNFCPVFVGSYSEWHCWQTRRPGLIVMTIALIQAFNALKRMVWGRSCPPVPSAAGQPGAQKEPEGAEDDGPDDDADDDFHYALLRLRIWLKPQMGQDTMPASGSASPSSISSWNRSRHLGQTMMTFHFAAGRRTS